ncbi:MAG: arsenite methyltransferase [Gemmatimonadota bacterium]
MKETEIRKAVRGRYGAIARKSGASCCGPSAGCGSAGREGIAAEAGRRIGYTDDEMRSVPEGANLGLGCGNPLAHAAIREGETVLDLGAGAGFDCFLAARAAGPSGRVIGVDMTPDMVEKARENARKGGYGNVEFRLGEIENLPVADASVDCVISNCVINLAPDKARVFREAFRVLKPGGRLMVSDIVLRDELPEAVKSSVAAYTGCIAGATSRESYLEALSSAGFEDIRVVGETGFPVEVAADGPLAKAAVADFGIAPAELARAAGSVSSMKVFAVKPGADR